MKTRPILFSGAMVRAILDGTTTQTRRPVRQQPVEWRPGSWSWPAAFTTTPPYPWSVAWHEPHRPETLGACPFGAPGDRLWARERARLIEVESGDPFVSGVGEARVRLRYEADGVESDWLPYPPRLSYLRVGQCVPNGVHREGARLFLEVLSVRVERLQDITEEDARAEGVTVPDDDPLGFTHRREFQALYTNIYGPGSWDANPWLWVVEFRRVEER
jgi:hypothetical protein